jgi:hypothetical protein
VHIYAGNVCEVTSLSMPLDERQPARGIVDG